MARTGDPSLPEGPIPRCPKGRFPAASAPAHLVAPHGPHARRALALLRAAMPNLAQTTASRVGQFVKAPRARRIGLWILGIVAAIGIVGFFVVPPIAKSYLVTALSKELKREVTIES